MNSPKKALKKLESIVLKWEDNSQLADMYFASSKIIVMELNRMLKEKPEQYNKGYTSEKLVSLEWSLDAMFGCDIDNGHDFEQHLIWALGNIQSLNSSLCFGK